MAARLPPPVAAASAAGVAAVAAGVAAVAAVVAVAAVAALALSGGAIAAEADAGHRNLQQGGAALGDALFVSTRKPAAAPGPED